jgi:hypothetical protein
MIKIFLDFFKGYKKEAERRRVDNILKSINKDRVL